MIKIANRQIFIFFFDFLKKNMGPSNMGPCIFLMSQKKEKFIEKCLSVRLLVRRKTNRVTGILDTSYVRFTTPN